MSTGRDEKAADLANEGLSPAKGGTGDAAAAAANADTSAAKDVPQETMPDATQVMAEGLNYLAGKSDKAS